MMDNPTAKIVRDLRHCAKESDGGCGTCERIKETGGDWSCVARLMRESAERLEQQAEHIARVEAERDAARNKTVELVFGKGAFGVCPVAEGEDASEREVLIRRLKSPVLPIGAALGDKGKTLDELENIKVRMRFENVESARVLERVLQIVINSFGEPQRGAQGEG